MNIDKKNKLKILIQKEVKKQLYESWSWRGEDNSSQDTSTKIPQRFQSSQEEREKIKAKVYSKYENLQSKDIATDGFMLGNNKIAVIAVNPGIAYERIFYLYSQAVTGRMNLPLFKGGGLGFLDLILNWIYGSGTDVANQEAINQKANIKRNNDLGEITNLILNNATLLRKAGVSFDKAKNERQGLVIGGIQLTKLDKCYGAWETSYVAAEEGWGPLMYTISGTVIKALESNGKITSDRKIVSKFARKNWKTTYDHRDDFKEYQFDNIKLPKNKRRTPDDESDDCLIHEPENKDNNYALNYAYELTNPIDLNRFKENMNMLIQNLAEALQISYFNNNSIEEVRKSVEDIIVNIFNNYFRANYLHKVVGYSIENALEFV